MQEKNTQKAWSKLIAKCWSDENFKKQLIANPAKVLKENGIDVPSNTTYKVVEESDTVRYLVIPSKPSGNLTETELNKIAAGFTSTQSSGCHICG